MPVSEPVVYKTLTAEDLRAARELLWQKRMSGNSQTRYADGAYVALKPDVEIATILGAIDAELARRSGGSVVSTILVTSSKGLE